MQGETQLDRIVDGGLVDHRQGAWQTQGDRGQLAVRLAAEGDLGRAEQLRLGGQFHVGFQTEHRVKLLDGLGVLHQFFSHDDSLNPFRSVDHLAWPSSQEAFSDFQIGPFHSSSSAASRAAAGLYITSSRCCGAMNC